MEKLGTGWEVDALATELAKDRAYFETSGGGVTISGGEPVLQSDFTAALLRRLATDGLHTALDTCGNYPATALLGLLPHTRLLLFDLKLMDPDRHRRFTGSDNDRILETVRAVTVAMDHGEGPAQLWIRTPVIPGATDDDDNIRAIGMFIRDRLQPYIERWELCAFNNLCTSKYDRLGCDWPFRDAPLMTAERMEALAGIARSAVEIADRVGWNGMTAAAPATAEAGADCCKPVEETP
jgi:pyruvate formate lyase activating enzyme